MYFPATSQGMYVFLNPFLFRLKMDIFFFSLFQSCWPYGHHRLITSSSSGVSGRISPPAATAGPSSKGNNRRSHLITPCSPAASSSSSSCSTNDKVPSSSRVGPEASSREQHHKLCLPPPQHPETDSRDEILFRQQQQQPSLFQQHQQLLLLPPPLQPSSSPAACAFAKSRDVDEHCAVTASSLLPLANFTAQSGLEEGQAMMSLGEYSHVTATPTQREQHVYAKLGGEEQEEEGISRAGRRTDNNNSIQYFCTNEVRQITGYLQNTHKKTRGYSLLSSVSVF